MLKRHVLILIFRVALLALALFLYFSNKQVSFFTTYEMLNFTYIFHLGRGGVFLWIIWISLVITMLYRLFPNKLIAMGARKHYSCSFEGVNPGKPAGGNAPPKPENFNKGAFNSILGWFLITGGVLIALRIAGLLSASAVLIIMLIFSVADLVFIMFFCPFQRLFMHNKCCVVCRIYNWDYFMMCAPLIVFPSFYSLSLALLSLAVVLRWEIAVIKNPHYFTEKYNTNLRCENCGEQLCKMVLMGKRK